MNPEACIIGDIGGTNARFAVVCPNRPGFEKEKAYFCADFPSLETAIESYLLDIGLQGAGTICLAVAGPIFDGAVQFTNSHWQIAEGPLKAGFGTDRVRLINDFEAIAWAVPLLSQEDCQLIGDAPESDLIRGNFTIGVLGPGTGLGAAGLVRNAGLTTALVTEAGHVGFAPETPEQRDLLARLQDRFERVSDERVASGAGLENIHRALNADDSPGIGAAEIFGRGRSGDAAASRTIDLFFQILGQIAGNLALSIGAFQGVYIAGGVALRHLDLFMKSRFRSGFENKGRHRAVMAKIPTLAITHRQPGLLGASHVARQVIS